MVAVSISARNTRSVTVASVYSSSIMTYYFFLISIRKEGKTTLKQGKLSLFSHFLNSCSSTVVSIFPTPAISTSHPIMGGGGGRVVRNLDKGHIEKPKRGGVKGERSLLTVDSIS